MRRLLRQRGAGPAALALSFVVLTAGASAADPKLITTCQEIDKTAAPPAVLTCDVRADAFADFKDLKARLSGQTEDLETAFEAFDSASKGATTYYLVQGMPNARRTTLTQMTDAVVTFADRRDGKRRFTAYSFANELTLVADSGASKNEFVRQVIAIKPATSTIQLYKTAMQAVEQLTKETGERKSLVILGDGTSDDTSFGHDQVVKAAKDAGITIHALGFYDDRRERPQFQKLSRLAKDTGGYAAEVKQGTATKDFDKDIVSSRFVSEVLENGGTAKVTLKGPTGAQTVQFTANLSDGKSITADTKIDVPSAPASVPDTTTDRWTPPPPPPKGFLDELSDWIGDNSVLVVGLGALLGLGLVGLLVYAQRFSAAAPQDAPEPVDADEAADDAEEAPGELLRDAAGQPVIYGWLETLDGDAARHPLRTTNVRVGRHRDNDICLPNDSISRRHAVLHYNADTRRFVITDLGGGNGVLVNKTKYKSRELNDGDTVELGEVRLRFRAEREFLA